MRWQTNIFLRITWFLIQDKVKALPDKPTCFICTSQCLHYFILKHGKLEKWCYQGWQPSFFRCCHQLFLSLFHSKSLARCWDSWLSRHSSEDLWHVFTLASSHKERFCFLPPSVLNVTTIICLANGSANYSKKNRMEDNKPQPERLKWSQKLVSSSDCYHLDLLIHETWTYRDTNFLEKPALP